MHSFLWADATQDALQVYIPQAVAVTENNDTNIGGAPEETLEQGVWISADPIPGCLVCNIGESEYQASHCWRDEGNGND